jgi:hypothetical protein
MSNQNERIESSMNLLQTMYPLSLKTKSISYSTSVINNLGLY